jgi:hypothetical protein
VIDRYREAGAVVLRTDEIGGVDANVGRDGIRVRSWRGGDLALPRRPEQATPP